MKRQVILSMFQDDASGSFGFAHENSVEKGFNAFYNGIGIFHDIFEHPFEGVHKHFSGDNEFNIGGEVAAMGALAYYLNDFYLPNRDNNKYRNLDAESLVRTTYDTMQQAVTDGYFDFGYELITIPYQKPIQDAYMLDNTINKHIAEIEKLKTAEYEGEEDYKEDAKNYLASLTPAKIKNLYRWGYKFAQKMIPSTGHNEDVLNEFINFWNEFTKKYDAEELAYEVESLEINVYTGSKMRWSGYFITHSGQRVNVKSERQIEKMLYPVLED
jgi:hypothetical protein